jgi:hypothetical protein
MMAAMSGRSPDAPCRGMLTPDDRRAMGEAEALRAVAELLIEQAARAALPPGAGELVARVECAKRNREIVLRACGR